jgi:hypothetical protein
VQFNEPGVTSRPPYPAKTINSEKYVAMLYRILVHFKDRPRALSKARPFGIVIILVNHSNILDGLDGLVSVRRHLLRCTADKDLHHLSKPAVVANAHFIRNSLSGVLVGYLQNQLSMRSFHDGEGV